MESALKDRGIGGVQKVHRPYDVVGTDLDTIRHAWRAQEQEIAKHLVIVGPRFETLLAKKRFQHFAVGEALGIVTSGVTE